MDSVNFEARPYQPALNFTISVDISTHLNAGLR